MSSANPTITIYGAYWCPDCRRAKQFLGEHQIAYTWVDIEQDPAAAAFVEGVNGGNQTVPTLLYSDGSAETNPSIGQVKAKLEALSA